MLNSKKIRSALAIALLAGISTPIWAQENLSSQLDNKDLDEVSVTGTRGKPRTQLNTAVPVDVIDIAKLVSTTPQVTVGEILNYLAPSFSSNKQSIQDGTDHIDPASLRGMGVDQVLVLVNGKRLHQTSLVNFQVGPGRGQVGTDMNTIPTAAIERIEILRDGAAAQYGSDAIAGVINIILKKATNQLQVNVTGGANFTNDASLRLRDKVADGEVLKADANYGFGLGKNGGYLNLTASYEVRGRTNRTTPYEGVIFKDYNATDGNGNYLYDYNKFVSSYGNATQLTASDYFKSKGLTGADTTDVELARRGKTRDDYTMIVGQAGLHDFKGYANLEFPISGKSLTLFATGGVNFRNGRSSGYSRLPSHRERYLADVYKDGYLPHINSNIFDFNSIVGLRGELDGGFKWELSNTFGGNKFMFDIDGSANTTYEKDTKREFDAGGHAFYQNVVNLDLSKKFDVLEGLNIALGGEYRHEEFQLIAGEKESYDVKNNTTSYLYTPQLVTLYQGDVITNGNLQPRSKDLEKKIEKKTATTIKNTAGGDSVLYAVASIRPGGSQVFPGFSNNLSKTRNSVAGYLDAELDVTKAWMVAAALRVENYSDFGSTFNYKLATRLKVTDFLNIRLAYNTGFRAPSLHQIYFENTTTQLSNGVLTQVAVLANDNVAATALGIPKLKAEQSRGLTAGFTLDFGKVSMATDFYNIYVDNRIVFTDQFSGDPNGTTQEKNVYAALQKANAEVGQFFVNAINTVTRGLDIVMTYKDKIKGGDFRADLAVTFSKTQQDGKVNVPSTLTAKQVFPNSSKIILENISPVAKGSLGLNYTVNNFTILFRNTYFGEVIDPNIFVVINGLTEYHKSEGAVITDLSFSYKFNKYISATIGANNLLDIYPTAVDPKKFADGYDNGRFRFQNAASQFGYNGRFLFARLTVTL